MTDLTVTRNKNRKNVSSRDELEALDNASLIEKIIQLEAHNFQLRRIIKKSAKVESHGGNKSWKNKSTGDGEKEFDFSKTFQRRVFLKLLYLGWKYDGFVEQEDSANTVEEHLFRALVHSRCIKNRQSSNYHRCGRTDKGVSAFSQVISLDIRSRLEEERRDDASRELDYCKILNRLLPADIKCYAWSPVESDKSARFDCERRTYEYFFPRGRLNVEAMNEAASYIVGSHDFRNFCKMDVGNGVVRFDRTVNDARVVVVAEDAESSSGYDMFKFVITSRAFLWHQIRCIMGVLLLVGQGKEDARVVKRLLDVESCPRKPQYALAHELPLNLYDCRYDDVEWIVDDDELLLVIESLEEEWTLNAVKSTMIKEILQDLRGHSRKPTSRRVSWNTTGRYPLLRGMHSAKYQPLMKRLTCESLENRIKHYENKRRIEVSRIKDTPAEESASSDVQSCTAVE